MKKLSIVFIGCFCLTLISCKTRFDNLAANSNDDVYYNPAKDPQPVANNIQNNNAQYQSNNQQQGYNPNAGKIAATHADSINPNYKDPKFNYDDYYDNAYAARVSRFQNPIYGTGYYDSYYTNQYSYTGNPSNYGNSIYNNYPSSMYNSYNNYGMGNYGMGGYNPYGVNNMYGSGYGSSFSMGYGSMYGSGYGMGYNPFAMNYGSYNPYGMSGYGYNPYGMGMGCGGYNPYGMGYSPYGYGGGYGYGMGGYGYNPYSTMSTGGYYNPYDYNSTSSATYNGPRTSHTGGNSTITSSNGPRGLREAGPETNSAPHFNNPNVAASPASIERFNQVSIPRETMIKITEAKSPTRFNPQYQPVSGGNTMPTNNGFQQQNATPRGTFNQNGNNTTAYPNTGRPTESAPQTRPTRWFNSGNSENNNNSSNTRPTNSYNEGNGGGFSSPTRSSSWGGGNNNGGGFGGGGGGGRSGSFGGGGGGGGHTGGGRR